MKKTPLKRGKPLNKIGTRGKKNKAEDAKTKKAIIALRGEVCEMAGNGECGGPLDLSHTLAKSSHPELRHDLSNCKILCRRHHDLHHGIEWKS